MNGNESEKFGVVKMRNTHNSHKTDFSMNMIQMKSSLDIYIVSWEPEGHYHVLKNQKGTIAIDFVQR